MAGNDLGKRDTNTQGAQPAIDSSGLNPFGNGFYVARWDPGQLPRVPMEIWRMTSRGPAGSALQLFVDQEYRSGTLLAALNEWTASGDAIPVNPGQSIIAYWNTSSSVPYLALYLRVQGS